ncbi:hypothetical protein SSAG_02057 [Streptomyces sp. Mg1]|nr:hypothetical protein SSAG_02057 [Streptomyces sp. Mg1]
MAAPVRVHSGGGRGWVRWCRACTRGALPTLVPPMPGAWLTTRT